MNKTKIGLLIGIAALVIVLLLQILIKPSRGPEIEPWTGTPDTLLVQSAVTSFRLEKENGVWLINDEKFPADEGQVDGLLDSLQNLKVLDQISSKDHYSPYELDEKQAIAVTVSEGGQELRKLFIGKISSTGGQTYVRRPDRTEVLLVSENLRGDFELEVDDLRDKDILSIERDSVKSFSMTTADGKKEAVLREEPEASESDVDEASWATEDGETLDTEKVESYLSNFTHLRAREFPGDLTDDDGMLKTIEVTTNTSPVTLTLISERENGGYLCRSSESPYLFTISSYTGEQFLQSLEDFRQAEIQGN